MSRIKLLLLIPHLGGGGAERVTALLASHLNHAYFDVHLVSIAPDQNGAEPQPAWVKIHRLNLKRVRQSFFVLIKLIWKERPDILFSNMAHLNFHLLMLKAFLPANIPIVIRQNSTASSSANSIVSRRLYRWLYPKADRVICQSQAMADDLTTNFFLPLNKLTILANPIAVQEIRSRVNNAKSRRSLHALNLLAVGRLSNEKGFDLLLHAIAQVRRDSHKRDTPPITATIVGTGPDSANLYRLRRELGLESQVLFTGYLSDLTEQFRQATIFVLPSRHEGMPNALLEAAAAGLPLVVTPCCQGVIDLLAKAPCTWIASSITAEALSDAILAALEAVAQHQLPSIEHTFLAPFELNTAVLAYESLLTDIVMSRSPADSLARASGP